MDKSKQLAPIVLFVYNRRWHTEQTIEALKKNTLAKSSEVYIYSDAPKNKEDIEMVEDVRNYLQTINGFKKITIIERKKNYGLADSIIDGVTNIINKYGKIIVLEDDLVTSPYFLDFMNKALDIYEMEKKVWHISGWNYPIFEEQKCGTFLWKKMNCWGWGTWKDRWKYFEKNPTQLLKQFNKKMIKEFNLNNSDENWEQVIANINGKINTWAVFWHATIFKNNGLCLNPETSFINNIGHDGSGIHCTKTDKVDNIILNQCDRIVFTNNIETSKNHMELIIKYNRKQKKSLFVIIINKISRILINRNIIG